MADYAVFASPNFDANEYANAIVSGEPYQPPAASSKITDAVAPGARSGVIAPMTKLAEASAKEDISMALSKLNYGIDDVDKQIRTLVTVHHEDLLQQASEANALEGSLDGVKARLTEVEGGVEKLQTKIHGPYLALQSSVARVDRYQAASEVLRRISRFVVLARRLEGQMSDMDTAKDRVKQDAEGEDKERAIAKAALSIAELVSLVDTPDSNIPLREITVLAPHINFTEQAQKRVKEGMYDMVYSGLESLNQSLLASSLQTAYNLRTLPSLVQDLLRDLSEAVEDRIKAAFDMSTLASKDSQSSMSPTSAYRSRVRTEPTNVTAPQWSAALWARLERMIEDMKDCCIKVYTLEKVLKLKKTSDGGTTSFLDEAMKGLEAKPTLSFWTSLSTSLERYSADAARGSSFLQQTLTSGYPRLLRLFHDFFAKVGVHSDTVYTHAYQSPETLLVLRSISNFESLYLSRSSLRLTEAIGAAFSSSSALSSPGSTEAANLARAISNELDSARFDVVLVKTVAKNAVLKCLDNVINRIDGMITRDRSSVSLTGPRATAQQTINVNVACFCYTLWQRLNEVDVEVIVHSILSSNVHKFHATYESIVDPILSAIRRDMASILSRLHRVDFGKTLEDPMSSIGGGASLYMKDLVERLSFIKTEILALYDSIGADERREWTLKLAKYIMRVFVLHVSIAKPLSESGKLQLTTDMTELEFACSAFLAETGPGVGSTASKRASRRGVNLESVVGEEYKTLRAMRPLLFLETTQLSSESQTAGVPPLIVLHHILVRSSPHIQLPHEVHGWQETEYVKWVDEHEEKECWMLVKSALDRWEQVEEENDHDGDVYMDLARQVLNRAADLS